MISSRRYVIFALFAVVGLVIGCHKEQPNSNPNPAPNTGGPPGPTGGPEATGPHADGIKVFNQKCGGCHAINGAKKKGPDLGKVAAEPAHTEEWLQKFILNPHDQKPNSKGMPAFQGKISDEEMKSLLAYLVTLK